MRRKLARQSLVALAVLVVSLMVAGLGLAGRQAYAAEDADASSTTITFKAGEGGAVGPEEDLVQTFSAHDKGEVAAVTATPADGYVFVDWTRDGEEVSTEATFAPVKETATYVANFKAVDTSSSGSASTDDTDLGLNPDHLTGPEEGDGTIDESVYPEVDFGSSPSPSRLLSMRLMALPTADSGHPTQPGEVKLSKTATAVDGMVNTWDVTVRVEGKDTTKTSDIVLVIDRSGSMDDNGRMKAAKEAAKQFVSTLLPDEHTRIAIVSFARGVTIDQGLTNDSSALNRAINRIYADGGTFTQAGIKQAETLLANSNADVKNIVLLSDGEPTYSYDIKNPTNYLTNLVYGYVDNGYVGGWTGWHYDTNTSVPSTEFNYPKAVGEGNSLQTFGEWYRRNRWYYNHGNSTIAEATIAKNAGYTMWTVAVNAGDTGKSVLSQCATDHNHAKSTEKPEELKKIFTEIAGNIKAAVQDASVTDPMGTGFTIPAGSVDSITTSQGTATYDADKKTINWEVGTLSNTIDDDPTVKYAKLTYRVTIDDSILTATPEADGKSYKTNGTTTINYKDATGADKTGEFVSPTVDPVLLVVQKKLYDKNGNEVTNSDQEFSVNVKGDAKSGEAYDQTYTLKPGDRKVLTNLRWEDTYTATETGYPDGKSKDDYTTEVKVGDDVTNSFTVHQGADDKDIVVTNREHPTLTLSKTVTGDLADKTKEFTFNVTVKRGDQTVIDNKTYTLKDGDSKTIAPDSGALLPGDQVTITEANGDGYTATYKVGDASEQTGSEARFSLSGDTKVSFTNSKPLVPITGLDGNEGIPILPAVLGVGAITAVLCVAITRRHGVRGE
ncbi:hypothetical protein AUL39_00920 [Tractidigestivibacter scatoligenes]|uniref:VWFA domain-containing protein n=1 Tax=Tractidigestivibacter scatoligenes TaxID=1299998 RepID=A0A100YWF5_TRASO|nr:VWA domain-containing protein [Tractidigestivibacter scatoligenes]KUH58939.1 hypothetical protein AUL39_00920 [Tractidigestivibacter scatoligenes]